MADLTREEMRDDFFDLHKMEAFADYKEEEIPEGIVGLANEKNVTLIDTIWYTELAVRGFPVWGLRQRREEGLTLVESLEGRQRRAGCQQARNRQYWKCVAIREEEEGACHMLLCCNLLQCVG